MSGKPTSDVVVSLNTCQAAPNTPTLKFEEFDLGIVITSDEFWSRTHSAYIKALLILR